MKDKMACSTTIVVDSADIRAENTIRIGDEYFKVVRVIDNKDGTMSLEVRLPKKKGSL